MKKLFLVVTFTLFCIQYLSAFSLKGRIVNQNGQGIGDVYVVIEKTFIHTISQEDGSFRLSDIPEGLYERNEI